ncbi:MAG: hypothetical protein BGP11_08430 [Rhodobacterales bacterium 65-51]|uniref:gp436 family protein n=1 Tax=uncultured Gemmobacter sp. TaxID=1095917 RepID=UPI0009597F4A|nr:phage protein Gp36 family protein [uncultured Gemmobacter sp.]OJY36360.1 MAG: hypothetical protein BGP11_08430 [Rhodobacterales bacterium 65-51]
MTYATLADLVARAGDAEIRQIADRDRDGTPDPEVIAAALQGADDTINGYVGAKYDLPFPVVPSLVITWATSIARYTLHRNGAPKHVRDDYDDAKAALRDVQAGRMALTVGANDPAPVNQTGQIMAAHPPEVFTPQKLAGWK